MTIADMNTVDEVVTVALQVGKRCPELPFEALWHAAIGVLELGDSANLDAAIERLARAFAELGA